jgi:hypothetical protein
VKILITLCGATRFFEADAWQVKDGVLQLFRAENSIALFAQSEWVSAELVEETPKAVKS